MYLCSFEIFNLILQGKCEPRQMLILSQYICGKRAKILLLISLPYYNALPFDINILIEAVSFRKIIGFEGCERKKLILNWLFLLMV